jgi:phosphinothricin acetyltransferase
MGSSYKANRRNFIPATPGLLSTGGECSNADGVNDMQIRDAVLADFEEITEIYNQIVLTTTAIYSDQISTIEERVAWWRGRTAKGFPVQVATDAGSVIGFASFGEFRAWPGYRFTVEGTVHIRSTARGLGVGSALLHQLVKLAREMGMHTMIAGVDAENEASLRLLGRFGFERVGHFREVGYKFGRFLDLIFLQCLLTPLSEASSRTGDRK